MNRNLPAPDWDQWDPNMNITVSDMKLYFENYTDVTDNKAEKNTLDIGALDSRVTAIEQSTPVGPGGKGAYLNLGGTPERYPTPSEMIDGDTTDETSFLVIARSDGIYFYNPKSKLLIPPKKGGGTVAVHAQFPQLFAAEHAHDHEGRAGLSGVYTAKTSDVGLDGLFLAYDICTLLVVVGENNEEYQTAFSPDGTASRIFRAGDFTATWALHAGGGGGGGSIDPAVIQEINRKISDLYDITTDQQDQITLAFDIVTDHQTRIGLLEAAQSPVYQNRVSSKTRLTDANVTSVQVASNPTVIIRGHTGRSVTLPDIVDSTTDTLTSTQVREGRMTYLVNSGDGKHTVILPPGHMFYRNGGMDSTTMEITPRAVFVYRPAIMDNGSGAFIPCWSFMGYMPLTHTDISGLQTEIQDLKDKDIELEGFIEAMALEQEQGRLLLQGLQQTDIEIVDRIVDLENSPAITGKSFLHDTGVGSNNIGSSVSAHYDIVAQELLTGASPRVYLPKLMAIGTTLTDDACYVGRVQKVINNGDIDTVVQTASGSNQRIIKDDRSDAASFTLKKGHSAEIASHMNAGVPTWRLVRSGSIREVAVNLKPITDRLDTVEGDVTDLEAKVDINKTKADQNERRIDVLEPEVTAIDARLDIAEDSLELVEEKADNNAQSFQDIIDGNFPIKWNNMKQKIAAASGNITAGAIAENAFTLGLGTTAGRTYTLPDIVDADTVPLPADTVREGRLTIISQQGNNGREVVLTGGCKFVYAGTTYTTNITIRAGEALILLPAIYGNGDKCWSVIGSFSSNQISNDLYFGQRRIAGRAITNNTSFFTAQVNQANSVYHRYMGLNGNTARYILLPEIIPFASNDLISGTQVRQGKEFTASAQEGGIVWIRPHSGQKLYIGNVATTADRSIPPGVIEHYIAMSDGWMLVGRHKLDGSPVELDATNATIAALEARIAALEALNP